MRKATHAARQIPPAAAGAKSWRTCQTCSGAYFARRIAFAKGLESTLRVVQAFDAKTVGTHTGDLFELAKRSKERMWRVEALMALGRVRYFAGTGGTAANQRVAMALLREIAEEDEDYVVRTAAGAARNLTVEEHRMP